MLGKSSHLVIEMPLGKSARVLCLKLVGNGNVKIPPLLVIRFARQEARHLFVLLDSQDISEIKHGLLPVSVLAMRTGREHDWLVACGEFDVEPSYQCMYKIDPSNVQDVRGLKRKIGGGDCVEID